MNRLLKLHALFFFLLLLYACRSSQVLQLELMEVFQVEEVFIQEEVPGMQGEKGKQYLSIQFSEESFAKATIDSILVKGSNYSVYSKKENDYLIANPLKVRLQRLVKNGVAKPNQAIIYFKKDDKPYYQIIKEILIKEPLYLP